MASFYSINIDCQDIRSNRAEFIRKCLRLIRNVFAIIGADAIPFESINIAIC